MIEIKPTRYFAALVVILSAFILPGASSVPAQTQPGPIVPQFKQIPLTEDMVRRFLATMDGVKILSKKYKRARTTRNAHRNPLSGFAGFLHAREARAKMQAILSKNNFASLEAWLHTAYSVMISYGYVKSGKSPKAAGKEMLSTIEQIKNNPNFTPEQRAQMMQRLQMAMRQFTRFQPLPENYALVHRMEKEIAAKMDRPRNRP